MKIAKVAVLAGLGLLALTGAQAQAAPWSGYVVDDVNERAGPSTVYPSVVVIPAGAPVAIYGCLEDYTWCDVAWGPARGWVAASYIQVSYDDEPVPLDEYIEPLGVPIIGFDVDTYWDDYYRERPFFGDAYRWRHMHPDHFMPPPPHGFEPPPNGPNNPYPGQPYGQFQQHRHDNFPQQDIFPPPGNFPQQGTGNFGHPKPHLYQPLYGNGGNGGQPSGQFGTGKPPKYYGGQGGQPPNGCHFDHGSLICPPH